MSTYFADTAFWIALPSRRDQYHSQAIAWHAVVVRTGSTILTTEDPRYGQLRVVPDHDVFFEFVPVEELGKERPTRHTLADVEVGQQYAVVITSCAGVWAYLVGDTVAFERRTIGMPRQLGFEQGEHSSTIVVRINMKGKLDRIPQ